MSLTVIIKPGDPDFYDNAQHERNAGGVVLIDGKEVANTLQCVHCGGHWVSLKGSGTRRGWCPNCSGPLCGGEECMTRCQHWEAKIEAIERSAKREV